jgi:heat shock protein HtpX
MDSSTVKLLAPFGVLIALVVFAITFAVGVPVVVAAVAGVVLGVTIAVLLFRQADSLVLKGLRVHSADARTQPRVLNVLDGLCDSHGFRKPVVVIVDDPARNACGFGRRAHHGTLALTSGLVESLDLMQLEGVLARELTSLSIKSRPAATTAVSVRRFLPRRMGEAIVQRVQGVERAVRDDFEAVRYTRYPPGLAAALAAIDAGSIAVSGANRSARHLWIVDPTEGSSTDERASDPWPVEVRIAALREL